MSENAELTKLKEPLAGTTTSLVVLPEVEDEPTHYKEFMSRGLFELPEFARIVTHNLEILDSAETSGLSEVDKQYLERARNFLHETWERYSDRLEVLKTAQSPLATIRSSVHRDNIKVMDERSDVPVPLKDFRNIIADELKTCEGPTVVVSESHATTLPLVQELKNSLPLNARIGLIVFDTHIDVFGGGSVPHKINVLRRLLREHDKVTGKTLIHRATVVGSPESLLNLSKGESSDPNKFSPRLRIIGEEDFERKSAHALMAKEIDEFNKAGVDHIIVSVDADVFRSQKLRYTGAEYSPLHALLWFGQSSFEAVKQDPKALLSRLRFNDLDAPSVLYEPELLGGRGLSLGDIGTVVDTIKVEAERKGIKFGIPIGQAVVLGDIVELSGPDFGGNTSKAALSLAERISGLREKNN
jgi:arginase family enzyme